MSCYPKIERVRQMLDRMKLSCEVEVDGGVDEETAPLAAAAGAEIFVAWSSIFGDKAGVASALNRLRAKIVHRQGVLQS
jgi:ribulose-phosphate 3-epimerase